MSELFVASLKNRIRAMNQLWEMAVEDLTLDQVNHHEREGVLPLAFSFSHYMRSQDSAISVAILKTAPIWQSGGWAAKIGVNVDDLGREQSVATMELLHFEDFDAYKAYQKAVIARTTDAMASITADDLAVVLLPQLPPNMHKIFAAMVVGLGNPFHKLDALECWVYQHGLRHMGEIEHGRALVGLGGMTS
ncbi:MAG: hypothetical protein ACKVVT_02500 [Dehalococcoidia bacterium]